MGDTRNEEATSFFRSAADDQKNDGDVMSTNDEEDINHVTVWRMPPDEHESDTVLRNNS
jgi:hypothetical protein